jgi:peptidoglycan/LPS O-acetylase OafA/YrhL
MKSDASLIEDNLDAAPEALRPPRGNPRFPAIDGLRGFAALAVVVYHADQFTGAQDTILGRICAHGDIGVTVFFLITGFLLYRPFFAAAVGDAPLTPARLFYWRRILRIVPGYWAALVVLSPLLVYAPPAAIPNFLFLQAYSPRYALSGIPPAWSVSVEMSFYLLLPVYAGQLARYCRRVPCRDRWRRELWLLGTLAVASFALRVVVARFAPSHPHLLETLPGTLMWFTAGMALAVVSVEPRGLATRLHQLASRPWACWTLAALVYAATLVTTRNNAQSVLVFLAYLVAATLLLMPLVLQDFRRFAGGRLLRSRFVAWLGLVSYGIYLYHYPIMRHIALHTGSSLGDFALLAVVGVTMAITCGALSYYIVERPALKSKDTTAVTRLKKAARLA